MVNYLCNILANFIKNFSVQLNSNQILLLCKSSTVDIDHPLISTGALTRCTRRKWWWCNIQLRWWHCALLLWAPGSAINKVTQASIVENFPHVIVILIWLYFIWVDNFTRKWPESSTFWHNCFFTKYSVVYNVTLKWWSDLKFIWEV